ncbi:four helix bundle protein [Flavobacterium sp. LS1R47]|uniref:Four helix bundle protein n=1 Tax=Flavobacterium frigoritolerans TaxID=2987686 RepID=A0A9X3C8H8_9FLAO|nr:four helix bundle protein [Flavobacterium frigoritolerans]MCV9931378.1 four helix bundle protein [Flavobacterium frigoritolerans]
MSESIVTTKSFELAIRGVNFYKWMVSEKKEFIMSKQFLRSITSVGANVREAVNAQSKTDFIHKLSIAQKECVESIHQQCNEVLKIIRSIIITSKKIF